MTLWDKGGPAASAPHAAVQQFLAGEDVRLDRALFLHDLRATEAHAGGLQRIGVLTADELERLRAAIAELATHFSDGSYVLDAPHEDGHSAIEVWLTERLGELGKKVHTGRSRNDQVLVALRLYQRDALERLRSLCCDAARALLARARADAMTPLPGYTHLQRAMPSSIGLWLGGAAESFVDDAELARVLGRHLERSPLGTAAGFGVNLPLDREGVAAELGFAALHISPAAAHNTRGKLDLVVLCALGQALLDVRRLAWDLSLFTTEEFAFVRLPERFTTGSSIMPNKRNPDVVELLRAAYAVVAGAATEIEAVMSLPGGYHRDLQATKAPLLRAVERGLAALAILPPLVEGMEFDRARMRAAVGPELHATDRAVELALGGLPFRDAYRQVARELDQLGDRTPEDSLRARVSPGAPGDLRLDAIAARLDAVNT